MDHSHPPPCMRIKKSASVSDQIIEYYFRFGQNRDLEKFLRLRRSYNKSKSSSDGSLNHGHGSGEAVADGCLLGNSGNNSCPDRLKYSKSSSGASGATGIGKNIDSTNPNTTEESGGDGDVNSTGKDEKQDEHEEEKAKSQPVVSVSNMSTKKTFEDDKKAFSFSCESNIAISILPPPSQAVSMPDLKRLPEMVAGSSQTNFEESKTPLKASSSVPLQKSPDSVVKTHKRLEWDSLGDVGYDKSSSHASISTLERSVLREFFAERGIEISFPKNEKTPATQLPQIDEEALTPRAQKEEKESAPKHSSKCKEKWRETLESVKKKYSSPCGSFNVSKNIAKAPQSTPKPDDVCSKKAEKMCQTSLLRTHSQEVQADLSRRSSIRSVQQDKKDACTSARSSVFEFKAPRPVKDAQTSVSSTLMGSRDNKSSLASSRTSLQSLEATKDAQTSVSSTRTSTRQTSHRSLSQSAFDGLTSPSSFEYFAKSSDNQNSDKENSSPRRKVLREQNTQQRLRKSVSKMLDLQAKSTNENKKTLNDLELGVHLLCSLIEAKNLSEKQKNSLAKKIVTRITRNYSASELISRCSTMTTNSSSALSIRSLIEGVKEAEANDGPEKPYDEKQKTNEFAISGVESLKSSTVNMEKSEQPPELAEVQPLALKPPTSEDLNSSATKSSEEQETMREWLDPLTKSEKVYDKKKKKSTDLLAAGDFVRPPTQPVSKITQIVERERKSHLNWIETEIKRLENLKHLLITDESDYVPREPPVIQACRLDQQYDKVASSYTSVAVSPSFASRSTSTTKSDKSANSRKSHDNIVEVVIEESEEDMENPVQKYKRSIHRKTENIAMYNEEEAHKKREKKTTKIVINEEKRFPIGQEAHRSKLETPRSQEESESVRLYAQQRKREFMESYGNKKAHAYDRPAPSDHYSVPRVVRSKQQVFSSKNDAYTSITSSDFCVSSEMSIPITGSSSSTTTTHQYDSRCGVGVQTTDSLLKSEPIFGPTKLGCGCGNPYGCICPRPTVRVYRPQRSQQVQVKPKSVAYVIKFDDKDSNENLSQGSAESLTLQEQLLKERPEFYTRANHRREILKKMHDLRQERDEQIRDIVDNTSMTSIPRKLAELPPPPTKYTRIFPTKEMKAMTRRKYSKLPEVLAKKERDKKERRKKSNRILTDVFNKQLQRRVHSGKLSLEHSRTVI